MDMSNDDTMDVCKLQELYKQEQDADIRERLLIVIWLKKGKTTYEVGELLGCPQSKVVYWKLRFEKEGLEGLRTRPRSGRPSKLPDEIQSKIVKKLEENPYGWTTKGVREIIRRVGGVEYSERHVMRLMHEWGFERITPRQRHILADDKERKKFFKKPESYWLPYRKIGQ